MMASPLFKQTAFEIHPPLIEISKRADKAIMKQKIIGRTKEQEILKQLLQSSKPVLLALYGRRRVGKTFLVKNFFENEECTFFYCSSLKDRKLSTNWFISGKI